ncbi:hypothetical protein [Alteromonas sp. BMJM2]|uniref:hypothetical protein n=1 Tax=Alteromonas sp. BMJM2 TaxID=2954241 RepID=UPI0022B59F85|nr:hypothetical protein [Alteromonas sp. BMJM2]
MACLERRRDAGTGVGASTANTKAAWAIGKAKRLLACVLTLVLTTTVGCTSTKADPPEMALLATSPQTVATSGAELDSVAVIETAIGEWFGGMDITLADNAFTASPNLSIERKSTIDKRGLPIDGRHSNPAFVFTLLKRGDECFIRNEQNNEEMLLDGVDCVAVKR